LRGTSGFDAAGRWALLPPRGPARTTADTEALEHVAKTLLRRYGVMCRKLLAREPLAPSWRELLPFYRTAEARGEIRGGRFIEPFGGEQFALVEAVEELRRLRRQTDANEWLVLAAADPANLHGITDDAPRAPVQNRRLVFRNGVAVAAKAGGNAIEWLAGPAPGEHGHVENLLSVATPQPGYGAQASGGVWRRR
jgi:ATP-dependent Lhr-like helicase